MSKHPAGQKFVKIYHGYGHSHNLVSYGHLLKRKPVSRKRYNNNFLLNIIYLLRLFFVKPVAHAPVELHWQGQVLKQETETDGFIKFEWSSATPVQAGWHPVQVYYKGDGQPVMGSGQLFVPHKTQYVFISDIDDTIMISHSFTVFRRLRTLFTRHPRNRKIFEDVARFYHLLSESGTTTDAPNPFFYVSSSEWNLYDYLEDFFSHNHLPRGVFLLNHIKRWTGLLQTGRTKHEGKLLRITRILQAFPQQQFILIGDNTQQDPGLYRAIAEKYTGRIYAVFIRNANPAREGLSRQLLSQLQKNTGVHGCLFRHTSEAIAYSRVIGLIKEMA
ncbi:MAG: App1 family protein [Bacteroidota bacterium]